MKRLRDNLFLIGNNCFNSETLEIFELEERYVDAIQAICLGKSTSGIDQTMFQEIRKSGLLKSEGSLSQEKGTFVPEFVAFRIVLGNLCNLSCRHCFVKGREKSSISMNPELLEKVVKQTFPWGRERPLKYQFFGGEPLLMFDLLKKGVHQIQQACLRGKIEKPVFSITTNGTLVTPDVANFLKENDFQVGLSLDGPRGYNDRIRGAGVFEKVLRSFDLLKNKGVNCWFLLTPYKEIMDKIPDFMLSLTDTAAFDTITFNTPFSGQDLRWIVDGQRYADMVLKCHQTLKESNVVLESAAAPILFALSSGIKRVLPCSISGQEIMGSISVDGRISLCAQYWGEDLFNAQFDKQTEIRWIHEKPGSCSLCIAKNICGGPCLISLKKTGKADRERCRFFKRIIAKLLENPQAYLKDEQIEKQNLSWFPGKEET